jgi:hypothetical protein
MGSLMFMYLRRMLCPDERLQWKILHLYICEFSVVTNEDNKDPYVYVSVQWPDKGRQWRQQYCRRVLGELPYHPSADEIRETEIHTAESRLVMT